MLRQSANLPLRDVNFKTWMHVYHHGPAFSNLVLSWVLLLVSPSVCRSRGLLQVLAIFFSYYLFIRSFCYVISIPIPCSKLFCFLCIRFFICLCAFSADLLVEISFVILEGSVLLALLDSVPVSFESRYFRQFLLVYFFQLYSQAYLLLSFFGHFIPLYPWVFFLP